MGVFCEKVKSLKGHYGHIQLTKQGYEKRRQLVMVQSMNSLVRLLGFKSWLFCLSAVGTLCLGFLVC